MQIFKLLGLFGVIAASTMFGFTKANALKLRSRKIERICICMSALAQFVKCGIEEVEPIIMRTFEKDLVCFSEGRAVINESFLSKEDLAVLNEFFEGLGKNYGEQEHERVLLYAEILQKQLNIAQSDVKQLYRLYSSLGFLTGLLICILFV